MGKYLDLLDGRGLAAEAPEAGQPPVAPQDTDSAHRAWADDEAQRLQQESPTLSAVDGAVRSVARRVPLVGSFMDEAAGYLNSGFGALGDTDQAIELERAKDRLYAEQHPTADMAGGAAGAIGGTVASMLAAPVALPASMASKIIAGGAAGGILGGIEGAGHGESAEDRMDKAASGARWGASLGLAAGPIAAGAGKAARWGMQGWQALGKMLAGMPNAERRAATRTLLQLEESGMSPQDAIQRLRELGPEGIFADVSPSMQMHTARVVTSEPSTARTVAGRLSARRAGARGRMDEALDDTFGPTVDRYDRFVAGKTEQAATGPAYEAAKQTIVDPTDVTDTLNALAKEYKRPELVRHLARVRRMLPARRGDLIKANTLHEAREYLDDAIGQAIKGGSGKLARHLGDLRDVVDGKLKAVGYADPDAAFSKAAKEFEDYEFGRKELLRGGPETPTPGMVGARKQARPGSEADMAQGVRSELGRQLTNQRKNPTLQAENIMTRDRNMEKVRELVGPQSAAKLQKFFERENAFHETSRQAEPGLGSQTAARMGGDKAPRGVKTMLRDWPVAEAIGISMGAPGWASLGMLVRGLSVRGLDSLAARSQRAVDNAQAAMLTATGAERVKAARQLTELAKDLRKAGAAEEAGKIMGFALTVSQAARVGTTGAEAASGRFQ